mmetsp:Transcript_75010/g.193595  ORF Transcript_75010/g.193595 Transcript_75010/m.193595 type:complete len:315 (+) Transcript_75010:49-993(+)
MAGRAPAAAMDHGVAINFAVGGVAGCVSKAAVAPLTRLTALLQTQSLALQTASASAAPALYRPGAWPLLLDLVRSDGLRGLWRGNTAVLLHRSLQSGSCFAFTGLFKRAWEQHYDGRRMGRATSLAASCLGATFAVTCTHPLDVVKTRLVTERGRDGSRYYGGCANTLRLVLRDEGLRGLGRGLGVSLVATAPSVAMSFFLFDVFTLRMTGGHRAATLCEAATAGGAAGACASLLLFPLDLVKKQMQVMGSGGRPQAYSGAADALRKLYQVGVRRHGRVWAVRELYRGLPVELLKVIPGCGIKFCVNESLLKLV